MPYILPRSEIVTQHYKQINKMCQCIDSIQHQNPGRPIPEVSETRWNPAEPEKPMAKGLNKSHEIYSVISEYNKWIQCPIT